MPPKISIIIPVYKVEKYLRRCLDSVCGQTITDIEIILVDDGSPDSCGSICDEYALRDPRIKVIHKENAGVSAARNSGLEIATGDYIGFVDSDDYVSTTMFEIMYCQAKITDADFAMCDFVLTNRACKDLNHEVKVNEDEIIILDPKAAFEVIADFSRNVQVTVWNKLYKKDLIRGIQFDVHKRMAEDLEFLMQALLRCKKVVYIPTGLYGYNAQRTGAATSHTDHDLSWYFEAYRNISHVMDNFAECNPATRNIAMGYKCVNGDMTIANAMVRAGNMDKQAARIIRNDIKKNLVAIIKSELRIYKKVQMIIFLISPRLYYSVMKKKLL